MGLDFAGEIAGLGRGTRGYHQGDRAFGFLSHWSAIRGTVAEYVTAPTRHLAAMPRGRPLEEAAAVPLAGSTALQALRDIARVRPGDRVCIHGASGGVGTFAIQIAKLLGAHVTTTSGAASRTLCLALGADEALDYAATDAFSGGRVFRVVFDVFGNLLLSRVRHALATGGVYVATVPSPRSLLLTALTLVGSPHARLVIVRPRTADLVSLARFVEDGRLHPQIDRVFPLAEAADAVRHLETWHAHGKVVVRTRAQLRGWSERRPGGAVQGLRGRGWHPGVSW